MSTVKITRMMPRSVQSKKSVRIKGAPSRTSRTTIAATPNAVKVLTPDGTPRSALGVEAHAAEALTPKPASTTTA